MRRLTKEEAQKVRYEATKIRVRAAKVQSIVSSPNHDIRDLLDNLSVLFDLTVDLDAYVQDRLYQDRGGKK